MAILQTMQPAWVSVALAGIIALLGFAGVFFGVKARTDRALEDGEKMSNKQQAEEKRLNDLVVLFREALAKQTALNEMVLKGLQSAVDQLGKLEARVHTNETALLIITNRWPEMVEFVKKHQQGQISE